MAAPADEETVSVIIPHYDQLTLLDACLASLEAQSMPRERFEVIVVDNASPLPSGAVAQVVGARAKLFTETAKGAGPARNLGVAKSTGAILAFIDADCTAHPNWLEEGVKALAEDDLVGGPVRVGVRDENAMSGSEAFERVFAFNMARYIEEEGFTGSGNLFVRRTTFDAVGGFRPAVSEDVDWCWRARDLGYRLGFHERVIITHPARETWRQLRRKWERINREQFLLARERRWGGLRFLARSYLLPTSILPHAVKIARSERLPSTRARLRGIGTLVRLRLWRFVDSHRVLFEANGK